MSTYWRSVKNEYIKLVHRIKYTVFLVLEIVICICALLIQAAANSALNGEAIIRMNNMSMGMLTFFIQIYIPLIVFMAASDLFSAEMMDNSVKAVLMRPISRAKVYFSKIFAIFLFVAQYLIALLFITTIIEFASGGSAIKFWTSLGSYLLDLVPLFILVIMAAFVNQLTKSSSLTMFLCIIFYAGMYVVGIIIPTASGLFFTAYLQWHKLWMGLTIPLGAMLSKIGILCGSGLVFGAAGFLIFDKRDF